MTFGTIYTHNPNPRTTAILVIAKAHGLDLKVVYADRDDGENYEELLRVNALGQVPTFVSSDGWVLCECIAITLYRSSKRDYYEILRWMSFANCDFMPAIGGCILPLIGRPVTIRKKTDDCLRAMYKHCQVMDDHLALSANNNKDSNNDDNGFGSGYLVGEKLTVADIFVASLLFGLFKVFHPVVHEKYPSLTRWFYAQCEMPMFKDVAGEFEFNIELELY
ncbi:glutathione S-transferase [Xylaria flabelliformis]|nr:glutathione S-transferase [Xylaria flabelliformis]